MAKKLVGLDEDEAEERLKKAIQKVNQELERARAAGVIFTASASAAVETRFSCVSIRIYRYKSADITRGGLPRRRMSCVYDSYTDVPKGHPVFAGEGTEFHD